MEKPIKLKDDWRQWAEALESDDYSQGHNRLGDVSGYCCLGVRCMIHGISFDPKDYYPPSGAFQTDSPQEDTGNVRLAGLWADIMNDGSGFTFKTIAAQIRLHARQEGWTNGGTD